MSPFIVKPETKNYSFKKTLYYLAAMLIPAFVPQATSLRRISFIGCNPI